MHKVSKLERNWILYDVGNSAFILLVSTIMPIYFDYLAKNASIDATDYMAYWGYAASFVTICVALLGPVMGTFADNKGMKKKLFIAALLVGIPGCALLGMAHNWMVFLLLYVIAKIGYSISLIFYDSMLTDVTNEEHMDSVSSSGFAWGYIGSCIPFLASLSLVLGYHFLHISFELAMMLAFIINAVWWFVMTLPLLRSYQQKHYVEKQKGMVKESFARIGTTLKNMKKEKQVFLFLVSFFFYIDGVYTIIDMATAYGQSLGLDSTGLLLALLVTQIVAFPCALIFGKLSQQFRTENLIVICIVAYIGIAVFAIFLRTQFQFWILAVCVGMFQGGIQALSRSHYAKIIPPEKSGEYFGIFDICGKGAAFLGTTLVSVITQITNNTSAGVSGISVLMIIGLILFLKSREGAQISVNKDEKSVGAIVKPGI